MGVPKLTYALRNDELLHISKVENGASCDCICPSCHQHLIARNKGLVREHHFAHAGNLTCKGAYETALHLLAKQVFVKSKTIYLPHFYWNYDHKSKNSSFAFPSAFKREIIFETVILEQNVVEGDAQVRPDAIGSLNGRQIYIEFANSHFIEPGKREKLKQLGIACIEIDLADLPLDEIKIIERLTNISAFKYWIINPKMDELYRQHQKKILEKQELEEQANEWEESLLVAQADMKYHGYKRDPKVKLLFTKNEEVYNCPIRKVLLEPLKIELIYKNPILKEIIDGFYWKPKIYGHWPNGKWFYFKNEMIYIYPHGEKQLTETEEQSGNLLFHGLNKIKEVLENDAIGDCSNCRFSVERFTYLKKQYEVCSHP